jgi:hypothetical protein
MFINHTSFVRAQRAVLTLMALWSVRRKKFAGGILNRDVIVMIASMVWLSRGDSALWRRAQSERYEFVSMMKTTERTMKKRGIKSLRHRKNVQ